MRIIIAPGGTCNRHGYGLACATRRFKGFYSQLSASSLELASKLKAEPQALRPAPASLSFYPAEKKVSKENGGHGMEHVVLVVFCDVNYLDSGE